MHSTMLTRHCLLRLPCHRLWRNEVTGHLYTDGPGGKESLPWNRLCGCRRNLCTPRSTLYGDTSHQAKVCSSTNRHTHSLSHTYYWLSQIENLVITHICPGIMIIQLQQRLQPVGRSDLVTIPIRPEELMFCYCMIKLVSMRELDGSLDDLCLF